MSKTVLKHLPPNICIVHLPNGKMLDIVFINKFESECVPLKLMEFFSRLFRRKTCVAKTTFCMNDRPRAILIPIIYAINFKFSIFIHAILRGTCIYCVFLLKWLESRSSIFLDVSHQMFFQGLSNYNSILRKIAMKRFPEFTDDLSSVIIDDNITCASATMLFF